MHGFNSYAPVRAPSSPSRANACDHARMTRRGHACDIGCLPAGRRDRNGCRRDPAWHRDARGRALTSAWISGGPPLPRIEDPKRAGIPAPSWRLGSHPAAQSIGPSRSCSTARPRSTSIGASPRLATIRLKRFTPQLLATVDATLRARYAAGLSVGLVDCSGEILRDDRVGLFMRLRFTLDDGDTLEIDSVEMSDMRRAWEMH